MFRDLLSNRLIQASLVFFVLVVVGSLIYIWHVERTTEAEYGKRPPAVAPLKNKQETSTASVDFQNDGVTNTPDNNMDTPRSDATEALPNETEFADIADAFLPDDIGTKEAPAKEGAVSPFGFGPYPKIPMDYPHLGSWDQIADDDDPEWELMARVMIKLWNQGEKVIAATMASGLVYPTFTDTLYIKWAEYEGPNGTVRYISEVTGDPAAAMRLEDITENRDKYESLSEADLPSDITFIPYSEAGINPYTFLNLPEK